MVLIKQEAPEEWRPGVDQQDPELLNIKVEEEEPWTSLEGDQLSVKEETDVIAVYVTEVPLKSEDDDEKPLFSQLHQHQVEDRYLPTSSSADQMEAAADEEDCGGAETTWYPDVNAHKDCSSSSETELSEVDEDDKDVNNPHSQLKNLSDFWPKTKYGNKEWKKSRAAESGVNTVNKSLSCSECGMPSFYAAFFCTNLHGKC
ncbi:uncharacterized protein LOC112451061, partial [Kryptolebias marmoratus]|uniref:uncharacterized protein LOC112451061 n=1 Tax=Kryptolebias marmoratus TaxID=37003 RepID=UPI0018ACFB63